MLKNFQELIQRVQRSHRKKRVAVLCADDLHTLEAVVSASNDDLVEPVLIGDEDGIKRILHELDYHREVEIIHTTGADEAVAVLVDLARTGRCDAVMKGHVDTKVMMRAIVSRENPFRMDTTISAFTLMEVPTYHKLLAITDGGLVMYPTLEQKKDLIKNSVAAMHKIGYKKPKVAILCAVDKVNPKMPETLDAEELTRLGEQGEFGECIVYGPLSYDLIVSKEAAEIKNNPSEVAGDTDLIICPDINTGNSVAKALSYSANADGGAALLGVSMPVIFGSRASSGRERYLSIVIASALSAK